MKHAWEIDGGAPVRWERHCSFGILSGIALLTATLSSTVAAGATALGVGIDTAGIIGGVGAGAIEGAGLGAAEGAITGGDPLKGAEFGGITGGALGAAGPLAGGLGISNTAADLLAGTAGGLVAGAATGQPLGTSALEGGLSGGVQAALSGLNPTPVGSPSGPTGGPATSAANIAAPASVAGLGPDVTAQVAQGLQTGGPDFAAGLNAGITGTAGPDAAAGFQAGLNSTAGSQNLLPTGEQAGGALGGGASGDAGSGLASGTLATSNVPGSVGAGAAAGGGTTNIGNAPPGTVQVTNADTPNFGGTSLGTLNAQTPSLPNPSFLSKAGDWLSNPSNLLPTALLGAGLLKGNQTPAGYNQLNALAGQDVAQGNQLQSYLASGTLPPGAQAAINQATASAQAAIRQQYANRGMSGSSAEAADLEAAQTNAVSQGVSIATSLLQQGVQESQLGQQIYDNLMQVNMQQDANLSSAVTNFASSLMGLNRPIQINTSGVTT